MDKIKDVIYKIVDKLSAKNPDIQNKIQLVWQKNIDQTTYLHTKIADFTNGKVIVYVDSSARLYNIGLKKNKILKNFQIEIPEIQDIILKVGEVR